jgi:hypothetical protein
MLIYRGGILKDILMNKKKKKREKRVQCIDCDSPTEDYYVVQTNRGDICKCANCYELWILREARQATIQQVKNTALDW